MAHDGEFDRVPPRRSAKARGRIRVPTHDDDDAEDANADDADVEDREPAYSSASLTTAAAASAYRWFCAAVTVGMMVGITVGMISAVLLAHLYEMDPVVVRPPPRPHPHYCHIRRRRRRHRRRLRRFLR